MFAYPAGGDVGASTMTTALVVTAVVAYLRRGSKTILALLLAPFAMGLAAAFLGRYPYGGSARTMQYVAPSIILMAGLGAAVLLARLPRPRWRERAPVWLFAGLGAIGLGMMAWDATYPYLTQLDRDGRDFARRFWAEESSGAELVCAGRICTCPSTRWSGKGTARWCTCATRPCIRPATARRPLRGSTGSAPRTRSASWSSARPGAMPRPSLAGCERMQVDSSSGRDANAS